MHNHQDSYTTGLFYEKQAMKLLSKKGYTILKHDYRGAYAQVDIIAQKNNNIFFVEVKKTTLYNLQKTIAKFNYKQKPRILEELIRVKSLKKSKQNFHLLLIVFAKNLSSPLLLFQDNPKHNEY